MKRFPMLAPARASLAALGLLALAAPCSGQESPAAAASQGPVVTARPGERQPLRLPPASGEGIRLSLDEAIAIAVANNADLNVSVNAAEASRFSVLQNQGIFDPLIEAAITRRHDEEPATSELVGAPVSTRDTTDASVRVSQLAPTGGLFSLGFTGNRTKTNSAFFFVNPSYTSGLTLFLDQPLLRGFGPKPTTWLIRISKNTRDAAYQDYVRSLQSGVNAVEQAYWDLVYSLQNLEVKKESLTIAQDLNRITRIRIEVGSLAPIDITQTEVGIATAEQEIITAEGLIGDAQDRLKRLLNFDPTTWTATPIVPTDQVQAEEVTARADEGMRTALERRPEVLAQAYTVENHRIRYEFYRNRTLPQLNLVGSYGGAGLSGRFLNPETGEVIRSTGFGDAFADALESRAKNWSIGLNFSYPILNRAARGEAGFWKYAYESEKARLTTVEQNVLVEVRAAARAIDTARRSIVAAQKGRELADRNLDAEKKKFDNGMTTSFQVTQIQRDLSVARTAELQALAVYRKALAAYHFAVADNLDWKGIRIEGLPETSPPPREPLPEPR